MTDENFPLLEVGVNQPDYQSVRPDMLVADVEHGGYIGTNNIGRGAQKCEYPVFQHVFKQYSVSVWRVLGTTMIVTLAGFAAVTMMQWTQTGSKSIREVGSDAVTGNSLIELKSVALNNSNVMKTIFSFLEPKEKLKMQLLNKRMHEEVVPEIIQTIDPWWSLEKVEMKSVSENKWRFVCSESEKGEFFLSWKSNKSKEHKKLLSQKPEEQKKGDGGLSLRPPAGKGGPEDLKLTFSGQCPYPVVIAVDSVGANTGVHLSDDDWGAQNFYVNAETVRSADLTRAANFRVKANRIGREKGFTSIKVSEAVELLGPRSAGVSVEVVDYSLPTTEKRIYITVNKMVNARTAKPVADNYILDVTCNGIVDRHKRNMFTLNVEGLTITKMTETLSIVPFTEENHHLRQTTVIETRPKGTRKFESAFLMHSNTEIVVRTNDATPTPLEVRFRDKCSAQSRDPRPKLTIDMQGFKSNMTLSQMKWKNSKGETVKQFWTEFQFSKKSNSVACQQGYYKLQVKGTTSGHDDNALKDSEYVFLKEPVSRHWRTNDGDTSTKYHRYYSAIRTKRNDGGWTELDEANDYWCSAKSVLGKGSWEWSSKKYEQWDACEASDAEKRAILRLHKQSPDDQRADDQRADDQSGLELKVLLQNLKQLKGVFYPEGKLKVQAVRLGLDKENRQELEKWRMAGDISSDTHISINGRECKDGVDFRCALLRSWERCISK